MSFDVVANNFVYGGIDDYFCDECGAQCNVETYRLAHMKWHQDLDARVSAALLV